MKMAGRWSSPAGKSRGAALFIVLMILLLVVIIGVSALRTDSIEERITSIAHDRMLAFESADAAQADAQSILDTQPPPESAYNASCTGGLCLPSTTATPVWISDTWGSADSIAYGQMTVAAPLSGVPPAHYIIEQLPKTVATGTNLSSSGQYGGIPSGIQLYRITVHAGAPNATALIETQTVYRPY